MNTSKRYSPEVPQRTEHLIVLLDVELSSGDAKALPLEDTRSFAQGVDGIALRAHTRIASPRIRSRRRGLRARRVTRSTRTPSRSTSSFSSEMNVSRFGVVEKRVQTPFRTHLPPNRRTTPAGSDCAGGHERWKYWESALGPEPRRRLGPPEDGSGDFGLTPPFSCDCFRESTRERWGSNRIPVRALQSQTSIDMRGFPRIRV